MAFGDRKADRVRFEHKCLVNLMGIDGTWRRSCVLLDVSATGARLEVEGTLELLGERNSSCSCHPPDWPFDDAS